VSKANSTDAQPASTVCLTSPSSETSRLIQEVKRALCELVDNNEDIPLGFVLAASIVANLDNTDPACPDRRAKLAALLEIYHGSLGKASGKGKVIDWRGLRTRRMS